MKKSSEEWITMISVTKQHDGKGSWFVAYCPICGRDIPTEILASPTAEATARGKIAAHICLTHSDRLTDPPEKSEYDKGMEELKREMLGERSD